MLDDLIVGFAESFEYFELSHDKGMEEVGRHFRAAVELVGMDETIKEIREMVKTSEGWTVDDLRVINEIAGKEIYNI